MENNKTSDIYFKKFSSHASFIVIFAILNVIMYFIFMRNEKVSLEFFSTLLALSTMALLFIYLAKLCMSICGSVLGFIIAVVLLVILASKFDEFLLKIGLPTDDSIYNPVFDVIGIIILVFNIITAILNFKRYRLFANAENEQLLQDGTNSDTTNM